MSTGDDAAVEAHGTARSQLPCCADVITATPDDRPNPPPIIDSATGTGTGTAVIPVVED